MTTVRDICTAALEHLGVVAGGETPSADDLQTAIRRLRSMLDRWSVDSAMIYALSEEQFPLSGAAAYTIGAGGDFNTARPNAIDLSTYVKSGSTSYPLEQINGVQYAEITLKDQGGMPGLYWYDPQFPLGVIRFWPVIDGMTLVLRSLKPLTDLVSIASASTDVALPAGYQDALETNLAVIAGPTFGRQAPADVRIAAGEGRALIARANTPDMRLGMPTALQPRWGGFDPGGV